MHNLKIIFNREMKMFFNTPMAYIFLGVLVIVNGYFFTNTFFLIKQSDLRQLFSTMSWIYIIFVPAITMGLIAKDNGSGTMEIMSTLPIKNSEYVLGKYFAACALILVGLCFTFFHYFTLINVGTNIDHGAILCGYFGLVLLGGLYASIGIFFSSITNNQVIAFIASATVSFTFFLIGKMLIFMPNFLSQFFQYISIDFHYLNITRGVIDSRNLIYFGSLIWFFLTMASQTISRNKWS
tara:strand:- start:472 stop:1185 length:714 start_codon:yes stop_codon:yes gene_type:complete